MGSCRETKDIWFRLFNRYPNGDWMGWSLFKKQFWAGPYLWHDSFGKYLNRIFKCSIFGHRNIKNISDNPYTPILHCFDCGSKITDIKYRMKYELKIMDRIDKEFSKCFNGEVTESERQRIFRNFERWFERVEKEYRDFKSGRTT